MKYTQIVVENSQNDTINSYLRKKGISYRYLSRLKTKMGLINLNGEVATANVKIKDNDIIEISNNPYSKSSIQTCIIPLDIVYEDDYLLIVNKPAGLSTSPSRSHYDFNLAGAIMNYMQDKDKDFVCRIINRLDKDACGLIVVAKNSFSASFFNNNISSINKTYYAIVCGEIQSQLTISKSILTITKDGKNEHRRIIDDKGLPAKTTVFPVKILSNKLSLVKIYIEQGRTHQIRVHLSSIEHPLLGDELYGNHSDLINHTALICKEMIITHPFTLEEISLSIPYPQDILNILERN